MLKMAFELYLSSINIALNTSIANRSRFELVFVYISHMPASNIPTATVYFDGACPVCSREIQMYRSQSGGGAVQWVDVAQCQAPALGADLTRAAAMARLHLRRADGSLVSGARAFTELWRVLPRWAWAGRLLGSAPGLWLLEPSYRVFLVVRRIWRWA